MKPTPPADQPAPPPEADNLAEEIRQQAITEYLPLVNVLSFRQFALLPHQTGVALEDLQMAGIIGLLDALKKFDPQKKVQFHTYAQHRIRGEIISYLRLFDWGTRELRHQGREIEAAIHVLMGKLGRFPNESEIAEELHLDLATFQQLLGDISGLDVVSIHGRGNRLRDNLDGQDAKGSPFDDLPVYDLAEKNTPLTHYLAAERRQCLIRAIEALPEPERTVINLFTYEGFTMIEISKILEVNASRVSQLYSKAVLRLRALMTAPPVPTQPPTQPPRARSIDHRDNLRGKLPTPAHRNAAADCKLHVLNPTQAMQAHVVTIRPG